MKKLVVMFAAAAGLMFAACTSEKATDDNTAAEAQPAFNVEEFDQALGQASDSAAVVGLLDNANAKVQELLVAGDTLQANDLIAKIKEVVAKNAARLSETLPNVDLNALAAKAVALPAVGEVAGAAVDAAADAAVDAAKQETVEADDAAKDAVKAKADEAVNAPKDKANEVVDKVKDKANEAPDAAKKKAADAAKKLL